MPSQSDLRQQITNQIVAAVEQNSIPWRCPWQRSPNAGRPANCLSRKCYSGINPLLLLLHALRFGFMSRWWGTYQQWELWGCKVKRRPDHVPPGHWAGRIVFYKSVTKSVIDETSGDETEREFPLMKTFPVFNADQVEGPFIDKFQVIQGTDCDSTPPDFTPAEDLIAASGAKIEHGGEDAFYVRPSPDGSWPNHNDGDYIRLPSKNQFDSLGCYYETAFHELAHFSEVRLGWEHQVETYAMGELVAEIAATYLSSELGVPGGENLTNHAKYVETWLKAMKGDASFIFKASTQASKVTDFLLSFARNSQPQIA